MFSVKQLNMAELFCAKELFQLFPLNGKKVKVSTIASHQVRVKHRKKEKLFLLTAHTRSRLISKFIICS